MLLALATSLLIITNSNGTTTTTVVPQNHSDCSLKALKMMVDGRVYRAKCEPLDEEEEKEADEKPKKEPKKE